MIRKEYNIYRSEAASFDEALSELLAAMVGAEREIVRIVLFGAPKDNAEYDQQQFQHGKFLRSLNSVR